MRANQLAGQVTDLRERLRIAEERAREAFAELTCLRAVVHRIADWVCTTESDTASGYRVGWPHEEGMRAAKEQVGKLLKRAR